MLFTVTIGEISVLALLIAIGYGSKKIGILNKAMEDGLSSLVLKVTLPALIIESLQFELKKGLVSEVFHILFLSLLLYGVVIGLSYLLVVMLKLKGEEKDIVQFTLIFSNVGYMGYPVIKAIYGDVGVLYTTLFNMPFNFLLFTIGIIIISRAKGKKVTLDYGKIIKNPAIVAAILGFILFLLSVKLPYILRKTMTILGDMTTPLSMLVIGSLLVDIEVKMLFKQKKLFFFSFIRLLIVPAAVMFILKLFPLKGVFFGVPLLIFAMPAAANTAVFATIYDADQHLASQLVFMTTLLSMITIPLWSYLI